MELLDPPEALKMPSAKRSSGKRKAADPMPEFAVMRGITKKGVYRQLVNISFRLEPAMRFERESRGDVLSSEPVKIHSFIRVKNQTERYGTGSQIMKTVIISRKPNRHFSARSRKV